VIVAVKGDIANRWGVPGRQVMTPVVSASSPAVVATTRPAPVAARDRVVDVLVTGDTEPIESTPVTAHVAETSPTTSSPAS